VPQQQFKVTLGDDLRAKLDEASSLNQRSIAEEIRQRLEMSFDIQGDPNTMDLVYATLCLAQETVRNFGVAWWGDERARSGFIAAIVDQILSYPIDETSPRAPLLTLPKREQQTGPDDIAEVIGRAVASNYRRAVRPLGLKSEKLDIRRFRELMRYQREK
jgi:hypothetical protein